MPAGRPGGTGSQSSHPNAILAQEAEAKIIELIKATPGLRKTEIAKEMDSKVNTTTQRLQRMRDRGLIERVDGKEGGWTASAAST
jgi:Mn-dependent DtxR family transcriptional regulator